jgi:hypothetical protein
MLVPNIYETVADKIVNRSMRLGVENSPKAVGLAFILETIPIQDSLEE